MMSNESASSLFTSAWISRAFAKFFCQIEFIRASCGLELVNGMFVCNNDVYSRESESKTQSHSVLFIRCKKRSEDGLIEFGE